MGCAPPTTIDADMVMPANEKQQQVLRGLESRRRLLPRAAERGGMALKQNGRGGPRRPFFFNDVL